MNAAFGMEIACLEQMPANRAGDRIDHTAFIS